MKTDTQCCVWFTIKRMKKNVRNIKGTILNGNQKWF